MTETKIIEELIEYSHMLFERKLIHASGGNTSVRRGAEVWISQTGMNNRQSFTGFYKAGKIFLKPLIDDIRGSLLFRREFV